MSSLFTDKRGSVYTEAISMLPVLIILWAGVVYLSKGYTTNQHSRMTARQCAWESSERACEKPMPAVCTQGTQTAPGFDATANFFKPLQEGDENKGNADKIVDEISPGEGSGSSTSRSLFGTPIKVVDARSYRRPRLFGDGQATTSSKQYLMCNEKERDFASTALNLAKDLAGDTFSIF